MRFSTAVAAAGLAAGAVAQNATVSDVYVTEVVTAFTTFCPEATMLTYGGVTHTVSEATTLTITHCPGGCTITKPAYSSVVTSCSGAACSASSAAPVAASSSTPAAPVAYTSSAPIAPAPYSSASSPAAPTVAPYPTAGNGTAPVAGSGTAAPSGFASSTGSATASATASSTIAPYQGAANKYSAAGAGVLAVFGLIVAL